MKKLIMLLACALAIAMSTAAQRTYVLAVGVSSYEDSNNNLGQTTKDAKQFKSVMQQQTNNVTTLTSKYANRDNILSKLRAICNRAQSGDKIIFFFAGHGFPGGIATYDRSITYDELNDILEGSKASAKICFVDACHSGSVNDVAGGSYSSPSQSNIIYMMACRANGYSLETEWIGHGYFTQGLLKGLRGKADADGDKKVTLSELFNYVYKDVQRNTSKSTYSQHPQLIGQGSLASTVVADWN